MISVPTLSPYDIRQRKTIARWITELKKQQTLHVIIFALEFSSFRTNVPAYIACMRLNYSSVYCMADLLSFEIAPWTTYINQES